MKEEKIIDKIKKLLAMANDERGNEHERDNALKRAHALIIKHGIDTAALEDAGAVKEPMNCETFRCWSMNWCLSVYTSVGKLFMTTFYTSGKINGTKNVGVYAGREAAVTAAIYMGTFIVDGILKEGRSKGWHNLDKNMRSFGMGAAAKIHSRIEEMFEEAAREQRKRQGTGTELAVLDLREQRGQEVDEYLSSTLGVNLVTKKHRRSRIDREAYEKGKEHGSKVNLSISID
ncbi:hypothetical protein S0112_037 [Shewanella phage S0112]|nr:hypothetical protein S0112_037 [Shewanella phage S0112]